MMPPTNPLPYLLTRHLIDHLDPDIFTTPNTQHFTDVTIDAKTALAQLYRNISTDETHLNPTTAPSYLPNWVLAQHTSDLLFFDVTSSILSLTSNDPFQTVLTLPMLG